MMFLRENETLISFKDKKDVYTMTEGQLSLQTGKKFYNYLLIKLNGEIVCLPKTEDCPSIKKKLFKQMVKTAETTWRHKTIARRTSYKIIDGEVIWIARTIYKGRYINIGDYKTEEEAIINYVKVFSFLRTLKHKNPERFDSGVYLELILNCCENIS